MKIRSDFVTNSSSSSFIIGKKDDTSATIESVFQTVKNLYKELLDVRDTAFQYVYTHPSMNIIYVKKDSYECFECEERDYKKKWKLEEQFEKKFGFSTWACFDKEYDWLECETYADYEHYWLDKMKDTDNWRIHAPFTIADFLEEKEIQWLHFHPSEEYGSAAHRVNSKSGVLGWYFPYIDKAFGHPKSCDGCWHIEYCEYCKEDCDKQRKLIATNNIPEDKACLYLLGRVCIHSESGYIHEYVVDKLKDIAEYYCNHMG